MALHEVKYRDKINVVFKKSREVKTIKVSTAILCVNALAGRDPDKLEALVENVKYAREKLNYIHLEDQAHYTNEVHLALLALEQALAAFNQGGEG